MSEVNAVAVNDDTHSIVSREIAYTAPDGARLRGYFAAPKAATANAATGRLPAVVVCPEWWGVAVHPKNRAEQLARDGYAAFAIDVYGDGRVTEQADQAGAWMTEALSDPARLIARVQAGLDTLAAQPETDAARLAVMGFCFGGKLALELARSGANLRAAVSFHGFLTTDTPAVAGTISAEILVHQAELDSMSTVDAVEPFKQEMEQAGVRHQVIIYPNAKHGFSNPAADERAKANGIDLAYQQAAATQSWQSTLALFARVFA